MKNSLLIAAAAMALATSSLSSQAACVHRVKGNNAVAAKAIPMPSGAPKARAQVSANPYSIVGLWHVEHRLPDGSLYFESLEHYHDDGTEFEFSNTNVLLGNICMGVYTQTSANSVSLYHIGWIFDDTGNPAGTFTLEGPRTLTKQGTHLKGTFDAKIYDTKGNLLEEDTGTTTGVRIPAP